MAAWGGSQAVAESVAYLGARYGAWISSRKRASWHSLSRSNPSSDHNTANVTAYAIDFATRNGAPLAYALARALGISNYRTGTYTNYYIKVGGATFRVQILWAVSGHFDHVHLGVRLISGSYKSKPQYYIYKPKLPWGLTKTEKKFVNKLRYHRYKRSQEARSGKGTKWRRHDNWCKYWYHEIEKQINKIPGGKLRRPRRRKILRAVLRHKHDWKRKKR